MTNGLDLPAEVRRKAEALGAPGRRWLASLPDVIAALEGDWEIAVGAALGGGTESYVAAVTTRRSES